MFESISSGINEVLLCLKALRPFDWIYILPLCVEGFSGTLSKQKAIKIKFRKLQTSP